MGVKAIIKSVLNVLPPSARLRSMAAMRAIMGGASSIYAVSYDWWRLMRYSGILRGCHRGTLEADIIKTYHRIEKGLALASPRPGFGKDAVELLVFETRRYLKLFGPDQTTVAVVNTLEEYLRFNRDNGVAMTGLEAEVAAFRHANGANASHCAGGTLEVSRQDILADGKVELWKFFASRHSIRQFSSEPVDIAIIKTAVAMAQRSPSVCNRQSGMVYVVSDRKNIDDLLKLQNGNRGFGEQIDKLLIVAVRQDTFLNVGERYQHWIDGGMFAMTLIWALHSLGLGTCCLNLSIEPGADRLIHKAAKLPEEHAPVMMIGVGNIPEKLKVAESPRRPFAEVYREL